MWPNRAEISHNIGVLGSLEEKKCEDLRAYGNTESSPLAENQRGWKIKEQS
jgi:hypothetical protein